MSDFQPNPLAVHRRAELFEKPLHLRYGPDDEPLLAADRRFL
jgi:hypothetical protein